MRSRTERLGFHISYFPRFDCQEQPELGMTRSAAETRFRIVVKLTIKTICSRDSSSDISSFRNACWLLEFSLSFAGRSSSVPQLVSM